MDNILIKYKLSNKQKEYLLNEYKRAIELAKARIFFEEFEEKQFDILLNMLDNRCCHDFETQENGKRLLVRIKNLRIANEVGHDFSVYYTINDDGIEHMPVLIGFKNNDGLFINIESVY